MAQRTGQPKAPVRTPNDVQKLEAIRRARVRSNCRCRHDARTIRPDACRSLGHGREGRPFDRWRPLRRLAKPGAKMKALLRYLFPIAMVGCVGCQQPVSPQVQQGISAGVSLVVCILNHITESPPQILTDCGPGAVSGVISTIDAAHRANDVASLIAFSGA